MTGGTSLSFTWNNNGQMLTKGSQSFSWDPLGRLEGLTNGGTSANYRYNGDGVRVGRTVSGTTTTYLQDLASGLPQVAGRNERRDHDRATRTGWTRSPRWLVQRRVTTTRMGLAARGR